MANLEDVLKYYLDETKSDTNTIIKDNNEDNPYDLRKDKRNIDSQLTARAGTKFKDGALYIDILPIGFDVKEKHKNRYFMSWGFFEDIILNSFLK